MLKIEKVLYPTDLSETSLNAVPMAAHLAKIHGADLHMLHVFVLHELAAEDDRPFPGEDEARRILVESMPEFSWSRVFHHVRRGIHSAPSILRFAENEDIDIIVMASHGRRGIRRLLMGSVAEEVVRLSDRPVMVIRDTDTMDAAGGFKRILVPVDFSDRSPTALEYGLELAATWNADLDVIHVIERSPYTDLQFPQPIDENELRSYAEERMQALMAGMGPTDKGRSRIVMGHAADGIVAEADRLKGTLVVMPSHGLQGMERLLLGSVAESVLRRARSPVVILRTGGRSLLPNDSGRPMATAETSS